MRQLFTLGDKIGHYLGSMSQPRTSLHDRRDWAAHGFTGETSDLIAEGSLPKAWAKRWAARPNAPILAEADGRGQVARWITAGQLDALSTTAARQFHVAGLRPGNRVVMSCAPSVDLIVAHVGALRLGAIVVPVNPAYSATEVARVIDVARPTLALADDPSRMVSTTGQSFVRVAMLSELAPADDGSKLAELDTMSADDPAMLMFTSGTTGAPKGVVLSHGNILSSAEALRIAWQWTATDRLVLALPLFHMHGLGVGVHGTLLAGASAVLVQPFDVDSVLDTVREQQATLLFGVPTMWVRFAASPRVHELAALRLCVSGSAPLATETWNALSENGGQRILERYGMTETVMNISNPHDGERRAGSVGLALPGVEVRLLGPSSRDESFEAFEAIESIESIESAREATTPHELLDEPGEIILRGPNVLRSYWERPDATTEAFTEDGWFRTGDLGQFDNDGYLRIVGRSKELIISGGFNVYPREVEETLARHQAVREAAVVGKAHREWGETVVGFVVLEPGFLQHNSLQKDTNTTPDEAILDELFAFAAEHLAKYKRPRELHIRAELPRNALGKIIRSELLP